MASREEVDLLTNALAGLSLAAQKDLKLLIQTFNGDIAWLREELPELWEELLTRYGSASSEIGAQIFLMWAEMLGIKDPQPTPVRPVDPERAGARLQWAMSTNDFEGNLMVLSDELVKQPARSTIVASSNASGVAYARVPSGKVTCAFCYTLASRGAVYKSSAMAGGLKKFHGGCDCQIVPVKNPAADYPDGYDPDAMFEKYLESRDAVTADGHATDTNKVLAQMRKDHPGALSDGVKEKATSGES